MLESFGAYKSHIQNNPLKPAPFFAELSKQGLLFDNFYVPSEGTARSMFGYISGVPDLTQFRTSSRNPLVTNQNSAARALVDYDKHYFLGGSANWGEIRGVIASSIPGIQIHEEEDYSSPRTDVWGISDYHLFEEAHKIFNVAQSDKPFFAIIQSSGFHRPYTIPENIEGFKVSNLSNKEVKEYGFISTDEYNSLSFQDFSLNHFFEIMKDSQYADNTVFIITADHGLPDYKAKHLSEQYLKFNLARFHVPLLFYGPKYFKSEVNHKIVTSPDVLVSVAGMLGYDFINKSMGRNIFAEQYDRKALMYVYHASPKTYSLIDDNFFVTGNNQDGIIELYPSKANVPLIEGSKDNQEKFKQLKALADGLYETSKYMLYNN